jgi:hypothetical protein
MIELSGLGEDSNSAVSPEGFCTATLARSSRIRSIDAAIFEIAPLDIAL